MLSSFVPFFILSEFNMVFFKKIFNLSKLRKVIILFSSLKSLYHFKLKLLLNIFPFKIIWFCKSFSSKFKINFLIEVIFIVFSSISLKKKLLFSTFNLFFENTFVK